MAIEFSCPRCQTVFNVSDEDAGTKQRCPHCQAKVRVPFPETATPQTGGAILPGVGFAIEFICPRCQTAMQAPAAQAGSKQRCPQCQSKVRVPEATLAVAPAARVTIEFKCPRCDELIRARSQQAGVKQFCPRCGGKVRIPLPSLSLPGHPSGSDAGHYVEAPQAAHAAAPGINPLAALAVESHADIPWTRPRQRQRVNPLGLLVPVACIGLIGAIGYWLMQKPPVKLEGNLAGERLTDIELGPFRVNNEYLDKSNRETQAAFERLEEEPIRASSQLLTLEFRGSAAGISLSLRTADGAEFYRVDPGTAKLLATYLAEHRDEFKSGVQNELTRSVPDFLAAVEKRGEQKKELSGLAEFRDSVGLASLVSGFGFYVQAAIGQQAYPCVLEDRDGRLFFVLPVGTEEFEIVGRDRSSRDRSARGEAGKAARNSPRFPGRYVVQVAKKSATINKEAPDPKEKIRKLLNK